MITAELNMAPLVKKLEKLGLATGAPMRALVREQARLFISSSGNVPGMIQVTPPFSKGTTQAKARKQGENKTRRDIRRVYGLPSDLYPLIKRKDEQAARAFWGCLINGKIDRAADIARRMTGIELRDFDSGALHRAHRKNGVVSDKQGQMLYVRDPRQLKDYVKTRVSHVGIYASGFNAAAAMLGAKGVPAWVTRHGSTFSGISIQQTDTSFYITISDKVPFGVADTVRRMHDVLRYRGNALKRSIPYIIKAAVKASGLALAA